MLRSLLAPFLILIVAMSAATLIAMSYSPSQMQSSAQAQAQTACQLFSQTGKTVCGKFLLYWQKNGGLPQFGYPISEQISEVSDLNGHKYTVQYFERAVLELHPENKPPYDVLLSLLGTLRFRQQYADSEPNTKTSTLGVNEELRPGVSISLIRQVQASVTGMTTGTFGTTMTWVFAINNMSNTPFEANIDKASLMMKDNSGKQYPLSDESGSYSRPFTLAPGESNEGYFSFQLQGAFRQIAYFDLSMSISGKPVRFRYVFS